jgi:hypothetical protein
MPNRLAIGLAHDARMQIRNSPYFPKCDRNHITHVTTLTEAIDGAAYTQPSYPIPILAKGGQAMKTLRKAIRSIFTRHRSATPRSAGFHTLCLKANLISAGF